MAAYTCTSNAYAMTGTVILIAAEDDLREQLNISSNGPVLIGGSSLSGLSNGFPAGNIVLTGLASKAAIYAYAAGGSGYSAYVLAFNVQ